MKPEPVAHRITIIVLSTVAGAVAFALLAPYIDVCWNLLFFGDCFQRGSTSSIVVAAIIGGALSAFLATALVSQAAGKRK